MALSTLAWQANCLETACRPEDAGCAASAGQSSHLNDVKFDSVNRILTAGLTFESPDYFFILRNLPDAAADAYFNGAGAVFLNNLAGGNSVDRANAIARLPGDGVAAVGESTNALGNLDMALNVRDVNGAEIINQTDDDAAGVTAGFVSDDVARAVAVDSFGRFVITGSATGPLLSQDMVVWRYTNAGAW